MHIYYTLGILTFLLSLSFTKSIDYNSEKESDVDLTLDYDDDDDDEYYLAQSEETQTTTIKTQTEIPKGSDPLQNNKISDDYIEEPMPVYHCPEKCSCLDDYTVVNCSKRGLTKVPNYFPDVAIHIDLSFNLIEHIEDFENGVGYFINCTNVKELILTANRLKHIRKDDFIGLKSLEHLQLANNTLTAFKNDIFSDIETLKEVNLSFNKIILPQKEGLLVQENLERLHLKGCNIKNLYTDTFSHLDNLLLLDLSENPLENQTLNIKAFEPLHQITALYLPEIHHDTITKLCNNIKTIDTITLSNYDVSCYELVMNMSFNDSTEKPKSADEDKKAMDTLSKSTTTIKPQKLRTKEYKVEAVKQMNGTKATTDIEGGTNGQSSSAKEAADIAATNKSTAPPSLEQQKASEASSSSPNDSDNKTYQVAISSQTINHILLGIIIVAVVGLIIGLICRRDVCGIKTKMCRTRPRRPAPTDQVRPAEEVPLNKV